VDKIFLLFLICEISFSGKIFYQIPIDLNSGNRGFYWPSFLEKKKKIRFGKFSLEKIEENTFKINSNEKLIIELYNFKVQN